MKIGKYFQLTFQNCFGMILFTALRYNNLSQFHHSSSNSLVVRAFNIFWINRKRLFEEKDDLLSHKAVSRIAHLHRVCKGVAENSLLNQMSCF